MTTFTHGTYDDAANTWLVGSVMTTRYDLEQAFGGPTNTDLSGCGKVTTEWVLKFDDGAVATIYDWKRYEMGAPAPLELEEWHIGGRTDEVAVRVIQILRDKEVIV